jgi:hypothetical protein
VDRAIDRRAHARRLDTPREQAYATSCRRSRALTFFSRDLLEDVDLEIALGHELLQPAVPVLDVPQPPDIQGL